MFEYFYIFFTLSLWQSVNVVVCSAETIRIHGVSNEHIATDNVVPQCLWFEPRSDWKIGTCCFPG